MNRTLLRRLVPHAVAIAVFMILSIVYFLPQLSGERIIQPDIVQGRSFAHEIDAYTEETGELALWTNAIFSGMPAYMIRVPDRSNLSWLIERASWLGFKFPIGGFIAGMLGMYILLLCLGVRSWLAILGAVALAFATNNLVLLDAGHNTKIRVVFQAAPLIAGMILAYRKHYLAGGLLFAAAMGISIRANHYQMTYYILLFMGIYVLIELVKTIRMGEFGVFAKATGILLIGAILGIGSSAFRILPTYEYSKDTMRGSPVLETNTQSTSSSSETEGLAWDYAMQWSNGGKDLLAMLVPRAAGGASGEKIGESSNLYQDLRQRGARITGTLTAPLYHGSLPFTSGPAYLGAVMLFLFFLGAFWVKGHLKWWLIAATVLSVLMSMGKHFGAFNQLLFDYLPLLNKFRAPSSLLTVTAIFIPVLGVLGVSEYLKGNVDEKAFKRGFFAALGITGGLALILALFGPSLFDLTSPSDARYEESGYNINALIADRGHYLRTDAFRSLAFIALAAAVLYAHHKHILKTPAMTGILVVLTVIDFWGIDRRYVSSESFSPRRQYENVIQPEPVDDQIMQDPDLHYRVHDVTRDPFNDALRANFHKLVGGYHPAKLQRYQDVIDYYLSRGTQHIFNMLNTKYFIVPGQDGKARVQRNPQALGNAWFVESLSFVETPNAEIEALETINPADEAVVHQEFGDYTGDFEPSRAGSIRLTEYKPDALTYVSNAPSEQFAVFSEIWYGPDKGWQAYVDGEPVDHIRVNYILRGMKVPAGNHTIEFKFEPRKFYLGLWITRISSIILLVGFVVGLIYLFLQWLKRLPDEETTQKHRRPGKKKRKARRKK